MVRTMRACGYLWRAKSPERSTMHASSSPGTAAIIGA
jgi:hypothetical protein